jgi:hypothetical protein
MSCVVGIEVPHLALSRNVFGMCRRPISSHFEMTQMSWFEPPLVMSRNYCEPRNVFNSFVEHSTASVARPAAIWPARAP